MLIKYRTKPVIISAIKWTGKNITQIHYDFPEMDIHYSNNSNHLIISTLEGQMTAIIGDYIIKGLKGEFYPCKPDIFEMKYERICEDSPCVK